MKIKLSSLFRKNMNLINDLKNQIKDFEGVKDDLTYEDDRDRLDEIIEETTERLEELENQTSFVNGQLMEFLTEVRDRKSEGEVVINELIEVLSLGEEKREWL